MKHVFQLHRLINLVTTFFPFKSFSLEAEGRGGEVGEQGASTSAFQPVFGSVLPSAWVGRHKAVFYSQDPQWQVKFIKQIARSGEHGSEKEDLAPSLTHSLFSDSGHLPKSAMDQPGWGRPSFSGLSSSLFKRAACVHACACMRTPPLTCMHI